MKQQVTRRSFLSATVAGGMSAASAVRVRGANDRIRLGVIGTGNRGGWLIRQANAIGGHQWVAFCDAWDERLDKAAAAAGGSIARDADYRKLLERRDIDGVFVSTWDNNHARIAIDACRAGKDVYVEKPMTNRPMEGHEVVKTAREQRRIVQVGMQQRSMTNFMEAKKKFIDSGLIGEVHMVRTIWNANTGYLKKVPPDMDKKPAGLNWEACLGNLPKIPWDPKRYFNRFAYWDISCGGQTGGLFVHMVDVVHWFLNIQKPVAAVAMGGIYQYNDGRDSPDNINLILEYPQKINVTFEATITDLIPQESADIVFMGSGGRLNIFRPGYRFIPYGESRDAGTQTGGASPERDHIANWFECMRSRKPPNADPVAGHYSSLACHIGNLAYQKKARIEWNKEWDLPDSSSS